jgi:hypothetical protein
MKKLSKMLGVAPALLFSLGLASRTRAESHTWTGWISDNICGAKGANAGAKDCTWECVKQHGGAYVFVNEKTQKVYAIQNQNAVSVADLGQEVIVTGSVNKDGAIKAESITPKSGM